MVESFTAKICVKIKTIATKIPNISREKNPATEVTIKNQRENPSVTDIDLNLGEDNSILNRIN